MAARKFRHFFTASALDAVSITFHYPAAYAADALIYRPLGRYSHRKLRDFRRGFRCDIDGESFTASTQQIFANAFARIA